MLAPGWEQTNKVITYTFIRPLVTLPHEFSKEAGDSVAALGPSLEQVGEIPVKLAGLLAGFARRCGSSG
jgi:hypothetical protein